MSAAAASSVAAASAAAAGAATTTSSATGAAGFSLDERFNHNKDSSAWEDLDKLDPCAFDIGGTLVKIVWLQRGETEEASSSKGLQNAAGGSEPEKTPRRHFSRRDSARPVLFSGFKQSIAEALADIGEDAVEEDGEDSGDGRGVKATPGLPPIHRNSKTILASPGASLLSAGECASEDEDGKEEARKPILLSFARCQGIAAGVERVRNLGLGKQEGFKTMNVTGGGAFVHSARIKSDLGLDVHKVDEMKSLILGLNWLLTHSCRFLHVPLVFVVRSLSAWIRGKAPRVMLILITSPNLQTLPKCFAGRERRRTASAMQRQRASGGSARPALTR